MAVAPGKALGAFIQAHRARIQPQQIGLAAAGRRRTPGLRREELAQLCGISNTWLTWIEQGRAESVSPRTLAGIARVLQLTRAERQYLFELAGQKDPEQDQAVADLPEAVLQAVQAISSPAYLLDRCWNAVAWNRPAKSLFAPWLGKKDGGRNLLRFTFCDPAARKFIADWEQRARRLVAEFRADTSQSLEDADLAGLVNALTRESEAFARYWKGQDVVDREGGCRSFHHPTRGPVSYQQLTLRVANRADLKLVILMAG